MSRINLRFLFALTVSKMAMTLQRAFGMNASFFPGKIAITICPDFLGHMEKPETIIAVTGTNGKTTVCNLIIDILNKNGYDILHNRLGSNINSGIASSLISKSTWTGKTKKKLAVFEIDERSSIRIFPYLTPTYLICTNLFRDSMMRNAHSEYIFNMLSNYIPKDTHLMLNADDLISSRLALSNKRTLFSLNRLPTDTDSCINIINDMQICPICHNKLSYHYVRYHHIGSAYCPNCDFASQTGDYVGTVDFETNELVVAHEENSEHFPLIHDSVFNIYNQLTVISFLQMFGLSASAIQEHFSALNIVESRYSRNTINGISVITNMAKGLNPIACSCVFGYLRQESGRKAVILLLEDIEKRVHGSENTSWIYDADFELLCDDSIEQVILSGVRSYDYKLRLLIAGVPEHKITTTLLELSMPDYLNTENIDKVFLLYDLLSLNMAMKVKEKLLHNLSNGSSGRSI